MASFEAANKYSFSEVVGFFNFKNFFPFIDFESRANAKTILIAFGRVCPSPLVPFFSWMDGCLRMFTIVLLRPYGQPVCMCFASLSDEPMNGP